MELVDTHAHLDEERFRDDLEDVIACAAAAGVTRIVAVGTSLDGSRDAIEIARRFPGVYATIGLHPGDLAETSEADWHALIDLVSVPEVVAIGETGLDFYRPGPARELQIKFMLRHLALACATAKPVVLHIRNAAREVLDILENAAPEGIRMVWHCFTGAADEAARAVALGLSFSVGGALTYRGNDELRRTAAALPHDRIFLETDSPYLTPEPHRARIHRNEPAFVVHVLSVLAEIMGMSEEDAAAITTANARRFFGLG